MANNKHLLIILILFVFSARAQTGQLDITKLDYNFAMISDTVIQSTKYFSKNNTEAIQVTFYPDSLLQSNSLEAKMAHIYVSSTLGATDTRAYDTIAMSNPWIINFPIKEYRLLSILNTSNALQKIFSLHYYYLPTNIIGFEIEKIIVYMQVKDESGNWKEVNFGDNFKNTNKPFRLLLNPFQQINAIVKIPAGNFETDIRFKVMVNAPPDFPMEKYVYSNIFKGRIDKSLLVKK